MSDITIHLPQLQEIVELLTEIRDGQAEAREPEKADWLTVNEVCAVLCLSKTFVYNHLPQLQAVQFDGAWRIPRAGIAAFVEQKRETTREPYRPRRSA